MTNLNTPPQSWTKGKHGDHDVIIIEVRVCQTKPGAMFSSHAPQSPEDQSVLLDWPGGGQRQVAHALLTEALRREAVVGLLVRMTKDSQYVARMSQLTEKEQAAEVDSLARALLETVGKTAHTLAEDIVQEALAGFRSMQKPS